MRGFWPHSPCTKSSTSLLKLRFRQGQAAQLVAATTLHSILSPILTAVETSDSPDRDMEPSQAPSMDYMTHGASAMPGWTPTIKKLVSLDLGFNCSSAEPGKVGMMMRRVRSQLLPNPEEGGKGAGVLQLLSGKHPGKTPCEGAAYSPGWAPVQ